MRIFQVIFLLILFFGKAYSQKPRLLITTDIGQDPDDQQSLVRWLHYANEFELEGIVVNADANHANEAPVLKDSIVYALIDRYEMIEKNLRLHHQYYPFAGDLRKTVKKGCAGNGVKVPVNQYIGDGKDTEGSDWILEKIKKHDSRPLDISVWGGACDVAQALYKLKKESTPKQLENYLKNLRVFFIGKQDSSNDWVIGNFPDLWLVLGLHRGGDSWQSGYRGMFWGGNMENTSAGWLQKNIVGKNALSALYPTKTFTGGKEKNPYNAMKEGDTPSWFYFLQNGLNSPSNPTFGGWGGRYLPEQKQFFRDADDTFYDEQTGKPETLPRATVFRWRDDFQNDFANRVSWGSLPYARANHYPVIKLSGYQSEPNLKVTVKPGDKTEFDASASNDPDGYEIRFDWFFYPEAGNLNPLPALKTEGGKVSFTMPSVVEGNELHLILKVTDNYHIPLCSYKRIIVKVEK
jgi:hypothetical protein